MDQKQNRVTVETGDNWRKRSLLGTIRSEFCQKGIWEALLLLSCRPQAKGQVTSRGQKPLSLDFMLLER